jgi:hypothetical protein
LGCIGFSYAFPEIRQKRLKPLNIRNACGERLEKRSLHPPPVSARDLPLDVRAYNRYLAWSWAFQGCIRGEPYSENTAEKYCRNAFGNFNLKKTTQNQKEKNAKKMRPCPQYIREIIIREYSCNIRVEF